MARRAAGKADTVAVADRGEPVSEMEPLLGVAGFAVDPGTLSGKRSAALKTIN